MRSVLGLHRLFGIEIRRQWLVLDVDKLERLLGDLFVHGRDTGNVIADITHFAHGQRCFVVSDGENAIGIGRVFACDYGDYTVERLRARGIDTLDACVGIRRMQNLADQHAGG